MNDKIRELISQYAADSDFTHVAPTKEMIEAAESTLGFNVPDQFLQFLNEYSYGGIGFEILGIGFDDSVAFLEETLEYREEGLPDNLLVVENCDEWLYCIDVNTGEVVSWYYDGEVITNYPSFDEYLLDRLQDAFENL